jgi:Domain of unknown function (DUF222)
MFDGLPDSAARADLDDAAVVAGIECWTRVAAMAAAHRLAFVAELTSRRYDEDWEVAEDACDGWDCAAAEVSAASGISQGRASGDMEVADALCSRLPRVGALLMAGDISESLARVIVRRTVLVQDPELLAQVDAAIAECALSWGVLSRKKLEAAIDVLVDRFDPGALVQTQTRVRDREVWFGESHAGVTEMTARMSSADAHLVQRRLTLMATGVCRDDPRTFKQRQVDAMGALGGGSFHLMCLCGRAECPNAVDDGRASSVVVHVYAERAALAAAPDPLTDGESPITGDDDTPAPEAVVDVEDAVAERDYGEGTADGTLAGGLDDTVDGVAGEPDSASSDGDAEQSTPSATPIPSTPTSPSAPVRAPAGVIPGFGIVPASLLAALIARGAKVRYIQPPRVEADTGYRPSTALDEFVRARDLMCRFPNCDRPAQFCDWDHTVPYPAGPTHASGGKMLCRKHHLLKTFWSGWSDVQHPDGTIVWTTPAGRTYTTRPGSSLFFPTVDTDSAPIVTGIPAPEHPDRYRMMPRRKRSRAKERAYRIKAERALNDAHVAERNKPPPF